MRAAAAAIAQDQDVISMRINENLTIRGQRCLLVPYRHEHVDTYHRWMQDPFLQQTTESEPLTMEQEYEMQRSWREDEDKCTFIVLDPTLGTPPAGVDPAAVPEQRRVELMSGDVNLYFNDPDDRTVAEIEVMVAEPRSRRKGIAREALQLLMAFAVTRLGVTRFRAKILEDNTPSLVLFQQLQYQETKRVAVFHEVHMELDAAPGTPAHARLSEVQLDCGTYLDGPS